MGPKATRMPDTQYFAAAGVSQSMLKVAIGSDKGDCSAMRLREYEARYITHTLTADEPTRSMELGTAIHGTILEGKSLDDCLRVYPPSCLKSNGHVNPTPAREWEATLPPGCTPCKMDELHAACRAVDRIRHRIGKLLESPQARFEVAAFWESTLPCKAKFDIVLEHDNGVLIIDLKTTADASPVGFWNAIKQQRYWVQEAAYREGAKAVFNCDAQFAFLAVEKDPGSLFQVAEYRLLPHVASQAEAARWRYMARLAEAYETGDWSDGWERECNYVDLPGSIFGTRN